MAKKINTGKKTVRPASPITETVISPVRSTPIPKVTPARRVVTHEEVSMRAYEIYLSGTGGTSEENWLRAERELNGL